MNNLSDPAMPFEGGKNNGGQPYAGITKREYACIHCGVPQTGDPELDAIIAEGNRIQKAMIDPSFGDLN